MMSKKPNSGPDFLVVGAMKCATTTLAFDLETSCNAIFPAGKEVKTLGDFSSGSERQVLAKYFEQLGDSPKLIGDASPQYTMHNSDAISIRAAKYLSPEIKIIYIVRNPVARAISHVLHAGNPPLSG